jgi:hypothetical protein
MAEMETGAETAAEINRPSMEGVVRGSTADLVRNAPEPSDKAKKSFRVLYPDDQFVMEGMPVVTTAGTPLTDEQAKKMLPVAEASGVQIVEVR